MQFDYSPEPEPVNNDGNPAFDPFDAANLRIDQSHLSQPVAKKLLTTVPVRKPHRQHFVRVHPSPDYRMNVALIALQEEKDDIYLVPKHIIPELAVGEFYAATLFLTVNRQKVVSLWPCKLPASDGRQLAWHHSALEAAELAMTRWIQVAADMNLGAYQISEAEGVLSEPEWPDLPFKEILTIAFRTRIVDNLNHMVIQKLRGKV